MPKGSPELTAARKEEIVNACEQLYQTMSFKDITIKEIGNVTSFTRTSIYNYFQTKEEIFLALYEREYDRWNEELEAILQDNEALSREELADKIAASISKGCSGKFPSAYGTIDPQRLSCRHTFGIFSREA